MSQAGCTFREQPSQAYTCGCLAFEPDPASERLCTDCKHPRNFHPSAISTTTTPDPPPINPTASSVPQSQALTTVLAALRAGGAAEPSSSATAYQAPTARSQSSSGARVSHSDAVVEANAGFRGGKGQGKGKGKGRASAKETKAARATKAVSETGGGATLRSVSSKASLKSVAVGTVVLIPYGLAFKKTDGTYAGESVYEAELQRPWPFTAKGKNRAGNAPNNVEVTKLEGRGLVIRADGDSLITFDSSQSVEDKVMSLFDKTFTIISELPPSKTISTLSKTLSGPDEP